jgi:F-type H+-transporting ATPase subunit epsilon
MATFNLSVLTPAREVFSGPVDTVVAPGNDGDFGVLPGHYSYITSVKPGTMSFSAGGRSQVFAVGAGFAQVSADKVSLVLSDCEEAATIDATAAKALLAQAEKALLGATPGETDHTEAAHDQAMALARLDTLDRSRKH